MVLASSYASSLLALSALLTLPAALLTLSASPVTLPASLFTPHTPGLTPHPPSVTPHPLGNALFRKEARRGPDGMIGERHRALLTSVKLRPILPEPVMGVQAWQQVPAWSEHQLQPPDRGGAQAGDEQAEREQVGRDGAAAACELQLQPHDRGRQQSGDE